MQFQSDVRLSLQPAVDLLNSILHRLDLKEAFETFDAANDDEIEAFWEVLLLVDDDLTPSDTTKKAIKDG